MNENNRNSDDYTVVIPTAPGANPSSFPDFTVPVEMDTMPRRGVAEEIDLPDGSRVAPNGAVIEEPISETPEILPPNRYTPEKEDLDLLIL